MEKQQQQFLLWYFLIAFLALQSILFAPHAENLAYSEFKTLLKVGKVENVAYEVERLAFLQVPGVMPGTREIDRAVRDILQTAFDRAAAILKERRETLERGARELFAHETLTEGELRGLLKLEPVATAASAGLGKEALCPA